ncbi:pirin family protein [Thiotrichales bacterium 19S3-7]|nr:pirin family protein [Thiotrichales bacterium 19S3-7]MCF6801817.1 pirin family protein [Thiotrichales bacterium 19S3-11]
MLEQIIKPKEKNLGGFNVRRLLPNHNQLMVGPWIFFDHFGPAHFMPGNGINVRPHPHINLATVTYLFEGEIFHQDSLGSQQTIYPGDINLMVAGKGIVHSERESNTIKNSTHNLHGLQLWQALPESFEEIDPLFHHYCASELPQVVENDIMIRVMIGQAYDVKSPVKTFSQTLYADANIPADKRLYLPQIDELAIYVISGEVRIDNQIAKAHDMVVFQKNTINDILAVSKAHIILIGGENIGQRYIEWNFVSSRKERIEQAKSDWKNMRFQLIPNDNSEFIPLPE